MTYKELAFDAIDVPGSFRPLFRWIVQPRFYIRTLFDDTPAASPSCWASTSHVAREVGHALGFWHMSGVGVMHAGGGSAEKGVPVTCRQPVDITAGEQFHARVLYTRELWTTYPDKSPAGFLLRDLRSGRGPLAID